MAFLSAYFPTLLQTLELRMSPTARLREYLQSTANKIQSQVCWNCSATINIPNRNVSPLNYLSSCF